jgi:hypothetical protein
MYDARKSGTGGLLPISRKRPVLLDTRQHPSIAADVCERLAEEVERFYGTPGSDRRHILGRRTHGRWLVRSRRLR